MSSLGDVLTPGFHVDPILLEAADVPEISQPEIWLYTRIIQSPHVNYPAQINLDFPKPLVNLVHLSEWKIKGSKTITEMCATDKSAGLGFG